MPEESNDKQKISRLSIVSVLGLISIILILSLNLYGGRDWYSRLLFLPVIASLFIAISSLIVIYRSPGKLKGKGIAISVIIVLVGVLSFFSTINEPRAKVIDCKDNLHNLWIHIVHLHKLPQNPSQWCDSLVIQESTRPDSFICPGSGAIEGESSYALNKNVYEKGAKLSAARYGAALRDK